MQTLPVLLLIVVCLPAAVRGGVSPAEARGHWAFQAPVAPELKGGGHPVDELLSRRQREINLSGTDEASRAVLLRRAWHVLTGLQPEPGIEAHRLAQERRLNQIMKTLPEETRKELEAQKLRCRLY